MFLLYEKKKKNLAGELNEWLHARFSFITLQGIW